ncbi:MAG: glycosyltransferase family 4 protein [Candidatus Eisenbacteria bacterium]|uniref:Glycosyltransferase family 4 protein n=1 Tax=Eiseniibacteriota bacterium TaxID=2212470 RepID=A0A538TK88_UNCEI|nr:MAG: glycosyltransferase family 4 protein [Candidatus Eisenbacteria bacterium]
MKVAFFGAFDPSYPRNVVLQEGLEEAGATVTRVAVAPGTPAFVREAGLMARWAAAASSLDALLVPAFGHRDVPLAAALGRVSGSPVLFDPLVSRWDTQVGDLGRVAARSLSALRLRLSDRLALSLADLVLCDTWEHGDFFSAEYGIPRSKLCRVPVGADRLAFRTGGGTRPPRIGGPLRVTYIGGFLPLHGVEVAVEAAAILEARHGPRFARFTLIGDGMTAPHAEREMATWGLRSVKRLPRVPYADALEALFHADVALGIFGTTAKAGRVVPHKVYQSMALGAPTITRRSRAIAEFFRDGEHLVLVPAGDAGALAKAVEDLAGDPARGARIGGAGRASVKEQASPERIGALLVEAVGRVRETTAPKVGR